MTLEINKLIDSDYDVLEKIGQLLYNREDQNGGLTKEELNSLLQILTVEAIDEVYDDGEFNGSCNAMH